MKNERQTIERVLGKLDVEIGSKRAELQREQAGWTEDRWVTLKLTQEIGAMVRERSLLAEKLRDLRSVDEMNSRPSGQTFYGSSF
jgi:hypothetical protein